MKPNIIVVVSDTHCGSKFGLLPPGVKDENGAEYGLNDFQRWMWNRWVDANDWVAAKCGGDPFDLVINGDIIEGNHHGTKEIIDPDPAAHGVIAGEALRTLANAAHEVYMVKGTECHTQSSESHIGKALGCKAAPGRGGYSWPSLGLERNGTLVRFAHHMSTAIRTWTEATGLGVALNSERLECARTGRKQPRVVVRSHRHVYGRFDDAYGTAFSTPCWQGPTRFVEKVKPDAVPNCGLVMMDFRNRDHGETPDIQPFTRTYDEAPRADA